MVSFNGWQLRVARTLYLNTLPAAFSTAASCSGTETPTVIVPHDVDVAVAGATVGCCVGMALAVHCVKRGEGWSPGPELRTTKSSSGTEIFSKQNTCFTRCAKEASFCSCLRWRPQLRLPSRCPESPGCESRLCVVWRSPLGGEQLT